MRVLTVIVEVQGPKGPPLGSGGCDGPPPGFKLFWEIVSEVQPPAIGLDVCVCVGMNIH